MLLRTTAGEPVIFADDAAGPEFFGARNGTGKTLLQKDSVKNAGRTIMKRRTFDILIASAGLFLRMSTPHPDIQADTWT
jgi:hypothetical protein